MAHPVWSLCPRSMPGTMQVINGFDGYDYSRMLGWTALSLPFGLAVGDKPSPPVGGLEQSRLRRSSRSQRSSTTLHNARVALTLTQRAESATLFPFSTRNRNTPHGPFFFLLFYIWTED